MGNSKKREKVSANATNGTDKNSLFFQEIKVVDPKTGKTKIKKQLNAHGIVACICVAVVLVMIAIVIGLVKIFQGNPTNEESTNTELLIDEATVTITEIGDKYDKSLPEVTTVPITGVSDIYAVTTVPVTGIGDTDAPLPEVTTVPITETTVIYDENLWTLIDFLCEIELKQNSLINMTDKYPEIKRDANIENKMDEASTLEKEINEGITPLTKENLLDVIQKRQETYDPDEHDGCESVCFMLANNYITMADNNFDGIDGSYYMLNAYKLYMDALSYDGSQYGKKSIPYLYLEIGKYEFDTVYNGYLDFDENTKRKYLLDAYSCITLCEKNIYNDSEIDTNELYKYKTNIIDTIISEYGQIMTQDLKDHLHIEQTIHLINQ